MRFIAVVVMTILSTFVYWFWFAIGAMALWDGHIAGFLFLAIGLWLVFKG
jgi:hypothetical protein